jgi:hypothetical protein
MKPPEPKPITKEFFTGAVTLAAFLGAYKFWVLFAAVTGPPPEAMRIGNSFLQDIAARAYASRNKPMTPEEAEAFGFCGMGEPQ